MPVGDQEVVQSDRLPIGQGVLKLTFQRPLVDQGVAVKPVRGKVRLSDGTYVPLLHVWYDPKLPLEVIHEVSSRTGEVLVWNIYRVRHTNGVVTEDAWTGNAGMIVSNLGDRRRRYQCSKGPGPFEPRFEFEASWEGA